MCFSTVLFVFQQFWIIGFDFGGLEAYVKNSDHSVLPNLQPQQPQKQLNMLSTGTKQDLPSHIPQHLPHFPDPHAYVRTPVCGTIQFLQDILFVLIFVIL